jgi:hypothetical protein
VRRSTDPNCPQAGQEKVSHGTPAVIAALIVIAFGEAAAKVATGSTTHSVVKGYRKKVRANRRRLTK